MGIFSLVTGRPGPSGFGSASTAEQVTDGIDATNLTAIVTGQQPLATSSIIRCFFCLLLSGFGLSYSLMNCFVHDLCAFLCTLSCSCGRPRVFTPKVKKLFSHTHLSFTCRLLVPVMLTVWKRHSTTNSFSSSFSDRKSVLSLRFPHYDLCYLGILQLFMSVFSD